MLAFYNLAPAKCQLKYGKNKFSYILISIPFKVFAVIAFRNNIQKLDDVTDAVI